MSDATRVEPEQRRSAEKMPLEQLMSISDEMMKSYLHSFTKTPDVQKLIDLWAAQPGIMKSDPVFIQAELMGHFLIQFKQGMEGFVEIQKLQNEVVSSMIVEIQERMQQFSVLQATAVELRKVLEVQKKNEEELVDVNTQFLECIPNVMEAIHSTTQLLKSKSWKSFLLDYATFWCALGAGVVIGRLWAH